MADTAKRVYGPAQPGTGAGDLYTVPAATTCVVRNIHVANTTGANASITLSIGNDAAGTRIFDNVAVPANGVLDWSGFLVLAAGEKIQGKQGTASALTVTISGIEIT